MNDINKEEKQPNVWVTKVVQEGDDMIVLFPPELMDHLSWKEGDLVAWVMSDDKQSFYIKRISQ